MQNGGNTEGYQLEAKAGGLNSEQLIARDIIIMFYFNQRKQGDTISLRDKAIDAAERLIHAGLLEKGETINGLMVKVLTNYLAKDRAGPCTLMRLPHGTKETWSFLQGSDTIFFVKDDPRNTPFVDESFIKQLIDQVAKYKTYKVVEQQPSSQQAGQQAASAATPEDKSTSQPQPAVKNNDAGGLADSLTKGLGTAVKPNRDLKEVTLDVQAAPTTTLPPPG